MTEFLRQPAMPRVRSWHGLVMTCLFSAATAAQVPASGPEPAAPGALQPGDEADTIVVNGLRQRGKVLGDIPPEVTLDAQDIRAIGASSIAELLQELAPQTRSARGRGGGMPIVLIGGKRVSGFAEIRNIPPEAIARVEILPEEVALKYGYRADQRVVNFVLRDRFRAVTGDVDLGGPVQGGRTSAQAEAKFPAAAQWHKAQRGRRIEGRFAAARGEPQHRAAGARASL